MNEVLVTDKVHPILIKNFEEAGYKCDYLPDCSQEDVSLIIKNYQGIIINSKTKLFKDILKKGLQLKFIGRLGSGMEIIDVEFAHSIGIKCFSVPEANKDAVAEHAIAMLLSLFNHLCNTDREVRNKIWAREKNRGIELGGKTVGIVGYGNTGKAFAKKLSGFGVEVLAYDKYLKNYSDEYVQESSLEDIFQKTDILSLHIPSTKETQNFCDKNLINRFKKNIFLINTSRGAVLNMEEIIFLLKKKKILGACLDVFKNEAPETFNIYENNMYTKLYGLNSVILSPHVAGWSQESKYKIGNLLSIKIINNM